MSQISGKFIKTNTVANTNLAQMATLTIKGNNTGGTANALDLTVTQVNAILPVFTSGLNGLAPASGGGTANFLRADGTWQPVLTGTVAIANGGTGQTSASAAFNALSPITTTGDLIYSASGATNSRLGIGSSGQVLTVAAGLPSWATPGGFANPMTTLGDMIYGGALGVATRLIGDTSNSRKFLSQLSVVGVSTAPTWQNIQTSDVSGTVALVNGGTGVSAGTANAAFNALSPLTTKGDILGYSTVNARLPVGTNGQYLVADSTQTLGIKWATASATTSTEWVAFTMVLTGLSGGTPVRGTVVDEQAWWRRVGDSMEIRWSFSQSTAGSGGDGVGYGFTIPGGHSIDTAKLTPISSTSPSYWSFFGRPTLGNGLLTAGSPTFMNGAVSAYNSTQLSLFLFGGYLWGNGFDLSNAGLTVSWNATGIPISGWTNSN